MSKFLTAIALTLVLTACGSDSTDDTPIIIIGGSDSGASGADPGGSDPGTSGSDPGGSDPGTGGSDPGASGSDPGTAGSELGGSDPGGSDPGTGGSDPGASGSDPGTAGSELGGSDPGASGSDPGTGGSDPGASGSDSGGSDPGGSSSTGGESSTGGSSTDTGGSDPGTSGSDSGGTDPGTGGSDPGIGGSDPETGGSDPGTGGSNPSVGGTPATGGSDPGIGGSGTGGSGTGGSNPGTGGTGTGGTGTGGTGTGGTGTGGADPSVGGSGTGGTGIGGSGTGGSNPETGGTGTGGSDPGVGGTTSVPVQVSVGTSQTCVVLSDGHVKCWGSNTYGQLGDGTTTDSPTPVLVSGISNAVQVSTYWWHTCALLADGTVWCWGVNHYGQLGNEEAGSEGSTPMAPNPNPVQMVGVSGALQVAAGAITTCVILAGHTVKCVGYRRYGTLGDGVDGDMNNYYSKYLVQVVGIDNAISVSSNTLYSCALLSDKTIKCWGEPRDDEFPTPTGTYFSSTPVVLPGVSGAVQLSVGNSTLCYISDTTSPRNFCLGTLPLGAPGSFTNPSWTISLPSSKLAIGGSHGCGLYNRPELTTEAYILCWGSNNYGEISNGSTLESWPAVLVPGIDDAIDISVGFNKSSCAVLQSGTMKCWGSRTGNSSSPTSSTPVIPDGF